MSDRLSAVERQLTAANKRIADLEAKYLVLLEDLKAIRAEMTKRHGPLPVAAVGSTYQPAFDRWPAQNPDDERLRNAGYCPTPTSDIR
jgi:hypothetical protein